MKSVGHSLTLLDLSGCGSVSNLTDTGLGAVADFCYCLEELYLSLLYTVDCSGLVPLIRDSSRALKLKRLSASVPGVGFLLYKWLFWCVKSSTNLNFSPFMIIKVSKKQVSHIHCMFKKFF